MLAADTKKLNSLRPTAQSQRITATEMVGDVPCRITLERDSFGRYREIELVPLTTYNKTAEIRL